MSRATEKNPDDLILYTVLVKRKELPPIREQVPENTLEWSGPLDSVEELMNERRTRNLGQAIAFAFHRALNPKVPSR